VEEVTGREGISPPCGFGTGLVVDQLVESWAANTHLMWITCGHATGGGHLTIRLNRKGSDTCSDRSMQRSPARPAALDRIPVQPVDSSPSRQMASNYQTAASGVRVAREACWIASVFSGVASTHRARLEPIPGTQGTAAKPVHLDL
jgi:hypothetical protein